MFSRFILIISLKVILSISIFTTSFEIQSVRIGPNPLLRSSEGLIVNYVASTSHTASYYLYSITGELIFQKSYNSQIPFITNAGECQFELINNSIIQSYPKQLYVLVMQFDNGTESEQIKKHVIIK